MEKGISLAKGFPMKKAALVLIPALVAIGFVAFSTSTPDSGGIYEEPASDEPSNEYEEPAAEFCASDGDCANFAQRVNCDGGAVCGADDGLCHCVLPLCTSGGCRAILCDESTGGECGGGPQYCETRSGKCAFRVGDAP